MGTKILGVIAFVAIAAAAGWNYQQNTNEVQRSRCNCYRIFSWNYQQNTNEVQLSDLALENAEALARGESGTDYCDDFTTMRCMTSGTVWMDMYHIW